MTYDKLFQLKGFEKVKLLTGNSILSKEIRGAHVVEIVEADWVKSWELIFLSGVAYRDTLRDLREEIKILAQRHVAGVVVEVGKYIKSIPEDIIDLAEELSLPLMSIPFVVSISEIIAQIYYEIYSTETENKSIERFLKDVLYGDTDRALKRIESFQYDASLLHVALYIGLDRPQKQRLTNDEREALLKAVRTAFSWQDQLLYLRGDEGIVAIQVLQPSGDLHEATEKKRDEIQNNLQYHCKGRTVSIGVGTVFRNPAQMKDSITACKKAYHMLGICNVVAGLRYYDEIGIYQLFFALGNDDMLCNLLQETLGPLLLYDRQNNSELVHTLAVFLEENSNIALTATRLFVHRNTVKYRIKRIQEILSCNIHQPSIRFNLQLAFKIQRYLR